MGKISEVKTFHLCQSDLYLGTYNFSQLLEKTPIIEITHKVWGPNKNYLSKSIYSHRKNNEFIWYFANQSHLSDAENQPFLNSNEKWLTFFCASSKIYQMGFIYTDHISVGNRYWLFSGPMSGLQKGICGAFIVLFLISGSLCANR